MRRLPGCRRTVVGLDKVHAPLLEGGRILLKVAVRAGAVAPARLGADTGVEAKVHACQEQIRHGAERNAYQNRASLYTILRLPRPPTFGVDVIGHGLEAVGELLGVGLQVARGVALRRAPAIVPARDGMRERRQRRGRQHAAKGAAGSRDGGERLKAPRLLLLLREGRRLTC